jgi:hypothetical protein
VPIYLRVYAPEPRCRPGTERAAEHLLPESCIGPPRAADTSLDLARTQVPSSLPGVGFGFGDSAPTLA